MRSPDRRETARHDKGIYRVAKKTTQCRRQRRLRRIPGRGGAARCTNPIRTENRRGAKNASPKSGAGQEAGKVQCGAARRNATQRIMRRQYPACKNPSYGRSANGTKVCRREKSRSNSMTARDCRGVGRKKGLSGEFFQPSENCVSGKVPDEQYGQKGPSNKS